MASNDPKVGDEVVTHHEHGKVKKHKKHKVVSVHYGPYYGMHGGGYAPGHACSPTNDPDNDGDNDTGSPDGAGGTESDHNLWDDIVSMITNRKK